MSTQSKWKHLALIVVVLIIVGAIGWQQLGQQPTPPYTTTTRPTTTEARTTEIIRKFKLFGVIFFDYNGNGKQEGNEPPVANVAVALNGVNLTVTNATGWYAISEVTEGLHSLKPFPPKKFRYMCESEAEFRPVTGFYTVSVRNDTRKDVGLMEGFLTLPVSSRSYYEVDRFYDRDPNYSTYLWWNGNKGYDKNLPRGFSPNHRGIDYYIREGEPVLAQAPGTVSAIGEDEGGKYIYVTHPNGMRTSSGHILKAVASKGDIVVRGQQIAVSGKSGRATELANYPHIHQQLFLNSRGIVLDPYRPTFEMTPEHSGYYDYALFNRTTRVGDWVSYPIESNPNMLNYWTVDNSPQQADRSFAAPSNDFMANTGELRLSADHMIKPTPSWAGAARSGKMLVKQTIVADDEVC